MSLEKILVEYKKLTIEMIEKVSQDIDISDVLVKRGELIEQLKVFEFDRVELKCIYDSLNIIGLEEELRDTIERLKLDVRIQINKLKQARIANNSYINFNSGAYIFSTIR